jgi:hypothetical protein
MAESLIVFAVLAFIAFLIWNASRVNLERQKLDLDAQAKVLEKIGPGQPLTEFLKTGEGKRFVERLTATRSPATQSRETRTKILLLAALGIIMVCAAFVFLMSVAIPSFVMSTDPAQTNSVRLVALLPLTVLIGAGVGALLAAWVMHRLSRKWETADARKLDEKTDYKSLPD